VTTKDDRIRQIQIDVDDLTRKYEAERERRLRADGRAQYAELRDCGFVDGADPFADPNFDRAAITRQADVVVIGGGFAGLLAGANLRKADLKDIVVVEKGGDFGGTWYRNRYPGVSCDVESYIYLPLLEDTGFMPSMKYATGREIFEYARLIGRTFKLYDDALFQTAVTALRWDEADARWIVATSRGDQIAARFVVSCTGLFGEAKVPLIEGAERFEGRMFHTSRWDYAYTGGDQFGNLTGLRDKTVAIIGTGATGIQAIPFLAKDAGHLYVFQRTPTSIDVRGNRPTDPDWFRSLKPGWQRERNANFASILSGGVEPEDMVDDGWTEIMRHIPLPAGGEDKRENADPREMAIAGMRKMEEVRRRVASVVKDPQTAEALKPYYHYFCKRPGFHDGYLDVFNQDNVTLVDTGGKGVERITPRGLVAGGKDYPADCIIFATGFGWFGDLSKETGMDIHGRNGLALADHWKDGPRTLHAMQAHNFPNFFMMRVIQAGASFNFTQTAIEQTGHIAHIIAETLKRGADAVEVTAEAEQAWVDEVIANAGPRLEQLKACTPSYYNFEGQLPANAAQNELYGPGPIPYFRLLEEWRAGGQLEGLALSKAAGSR
jgi:cyclohexanone monooxygenase